MHQLKLVLVPGYYPTEPHFLTFLIADTDGKRFLWPPFGAVETAGENGSAVSHLIWELGHRFIHRSIWIGDKDGHLTLERDPANPGKEGANFCFPQKVSPFLDKESFLLDEATLRLLDRRTETARWQERTMRGWKEVWRSFIF